MPFAALQDEDQKIVIRIRSRRRGIFANRTHLDGRNPPEFLFCHRVDELFAVDFQTSCLRMLFHVNTQCLAAFPFASSEKTISIGWRLSFWCEWNKALHWR